MSKVIAQAVKAKAAEQEIASEGISEAAKKRRVAFSATTQQRRCWVKLTTEIDGLRIG